MVIAGAGHDPSDDSECYYAHLDLNDDAFRTDFNRNSLGPLLLDPNADLDAMKELFKLGYRGFKAEKDPQTNFYTGRLYLKKRSNRSRPA